MSTEATNPHPCPECKSSGHGFSRIGNRRAKCRTCNAFARRLERSLNTAIRKTIDPEVIEELRAQLEGELYEALMKGN